MNTTISVEVKSRVVFHTTVDLAESELEEIEQSKSLSDKRISSIMQVIGESHKDFDSSQITEIIITIMDGDNEMKKIHCDETVRRFREQD